MNSWKFTTSDKHTYFEETKGNVEHDYGEFVV